MVDLLLQFWAYDGLFWPHRVHIDPCRPILKHTHRITIKITEASPLPPQCLIFKSWQVEPQVFFPTKLGLATSPVSWLKYKMVANGELRFLPSHGVGLPEANRNERPYLSSFYWSWQKKRRKYLRDAFPSHNPLPQGWEAGQM